MRDFGLLEENVQRTARLRDKIVVEADATRRGHFPPEVVTELVFAKVARIRCETKRVHKQLSKTDLE